MTKDYILAITADENDADYLTETSRVSMEDIEAILPVIEAIKNCDEHYNWPSSEYQSGSIELLYPDLDEVLLDKFSMYVPYGQCGVHTIESIVYYPAGAETKLL